jgi:hypothetical protein
LAGLVRQGGAGKVAVWQAGPGPVWHGVEWRAKARYGLAGWVGLGAAANVAAWFGRNGKARHGKARLGMAQ